MASTFEQFRTKLRTHTPHTTSPSKKYWEKGVDVFEQDRTLLNLTCEHTIEIVVSIPPTLTLFDNTNPNMSDY